MGEEPRSEPKPQPVSDSQNTDLRERDWRRRAGRKMSRDLAQGITRARGNVPEMFQKSGRIKFPIPEALLIIYFRLF